MSDDNNSEQSETSTYESGEGAISRRGLLQALGVGSLAAAELSGVSDAQNAGTNSRESGFAEANHIKFAENSEVIETDLVRVTVPTTVNGGRAFFSELARNGDLHASDLTPAPRDPDENILNVTGVLQVDRDGNNVVVKREAEMSESTLESRISVTVPQGVPGALIKHTLTNVSSEQVKLNTPELYIGTDIGLGQARLTSPGDAYRFSVEGEGSVLYEQISKWETFSFAESRPWVTSFDGERAISYGLDGPTSASDPNLAMVNQGVDAIRLFGTAVTLEPGESETWRTAAVAHDGGLEAPATGGDLIDAAFGEQALVYTGSGEGILYAWDAATGDQLWSFDPDIDGIMHSSPTVVNGTVYIGAEASGAQERYLYAVDAVTGDQEWVSPNLGQGGLLESSPTVVGGSVYTGGANGLFSLDAGTGNKQWQHGDVSITESSPAVADERVYAGTEGGELHAVKATNGNVEFTYPLSDSEVKSSPTIADGTLYIGTDEGELRAIGDQNWTFTDPTDSIDSSPTVSGGAVYVTAQDSTLYAVDAAEGTQEWVFSLDGDTQVTSLRSSPTVSGGVVYQATAEVVYGISTDGTELWRYSGIGGPSSSPTVYNGTVFVGSGGTDNPNDGKVVALDAQQEGVVQWSTDDPGLFVLSSPTVVTDPESGDSVDSRVALRTLGHHSPPDGGDNPPDDGDEQSATVSGVVRDTQSNDPLSGVTVEFVETETESAQELSVDTDSAEEGEPGEYSISLPVNGATEYEITVDTDGYEEFTDEITLSPDETRSRDISLSPLDVTATVEGTVRDEETVEGLPEVTVTFTRERDGKEFTTETFVDEPGRPGDVGGYTIQLPVDGGTETTYEIVVDTDGYEESTDEITLSPDETRSKDISLLPVDATVEGTVRDEQTLEGLPEVTVTFTRERDGEEFTTETLEDRASLPGDVGEYEIGLPVKDGPEATYEIGVNTTGYREFTDTVTLSPDDKVSKEIDLTPTPRIEGRVLDPTEKPLADISVVASQQGRGVINSDQTDDVGRFELGSLESGEEYTVVANKKNEAEEYSEITREVTVEDITEIEITLDPLVEELITSREETQIRSPVTIQPEMSERDSIIEEDISCRWRVVESPRESAGDLLRSDSAESPQDIPLLHTSLRPLVEGTYRIEVEATAPEQGPDDSVDRRVTDIDTVEVEARAEIIEFGDSERSVSGLVREYAPRYHFAEGERFYPTRYEVHADNSKIDNADGDLVTESPSLLTLGRPEVINPEVPDTNNRRAADVYEPGNESTGLKLLGDGLPDFEEYQDSYPPTIHAHVVRDTPSPIDGDDSRYTAVTYWAYYLYDPKNVEGWATFIGRKLSTHPSDNETVMILFDQTSGEPEWIATAQHYTGDYMRYEKKTHLPDSPKDKKQIDIYPAKGSHASYQVNTNLYDGIIPAQWRWDKNNGWLNKIPGVHDDTGSNTTWGGPFSGRPTQTEYNVVILTGDEAWSGFAGKLGRSGNEAAKSGGQVPQQRDRWDEPGEWIPSRMKPEHEVIQAFQFVSPLYKMENGKLKFLISFTSPNFKPHTFYLDIETNIENSTIAEQVEPVQSVPQPMDMEIEIAALDELPDEGKIKTDYRLLTYHPNVASDRDVVVSGDIERSSPGQANQTIEIVDTEPALQEDLSVEPQSLSTRAEKQISLGDRVDESVTVEHTGSEPGEFTVTVSAVGPDGGAYPEEIIAESASLSPGEQRDIDLSFQTSRTFSEGAYELRTRAWLETESNRRAILLDETNRSDAFAVDKPSGELAVTSVPPETAITTDNEVLGEAPIETELPVGPQRIVAVSEEGAATAMVDIDTDGTEAEVILNDAGELDIVLADSNDDGDSDGGADSSNDSSDDGSGGDGFGPGFGIGGALTSIGGAAYLLKRRLGDDDSEE